MHPDGSSGGPPDVPEDAFGEYYETVDLGDGFSIERTLGKEGITNLLMGPDGEPLYEDTTPTQPAD